jgi:hypothetical protein
METLARRVGVSERHIARLLTQLHQRGYELRVPVNIDKRGHPVFAVRGHRTVYQIPRFRDLKADFNVSL